MLLPLLGLLAPLHAGLPISSSGLEGVTPTAVVAPVKYDLPDLITLNNGKEIECRVLVEGKEVILARVGARKKEFAVADVKEIQSIERSLAEFFVRYDAESGGGIASLAELALFCEERALFGEARNLWIRVVLTDETNEQAWQKLGGVFTKRRGWRLKVRGRFYTLEQLRERVADWKNAMEVPTAHFLVKTDVDPIRALNVAFNLERAYLTFYGLLGPVLDLQIFDQVPEVHIPKNEKHYPAPRFEGDDAWYSYAAQTVYVNGSKDNIAFQAVYCLTQGMIDASFRRTIGGNGRLAPWAERALSEAFAAAVQVDDNGVAKWEFGQPIMQHFNYQAADEKPMTIKKLLSAGLGAYRNPPESDRFRAQSYTLLHFLVYEDKGKYREGLGTYLRTSFKGQSAATHLQKALGVKLKDIEVEWNAYVKDIAG